MSIPPPAPLAYEGQVTAPYIIRNFAPTTANNQFNVPTFWINPAGGEAYLLVGKALGIADWVNIASVPAQLDEIHTPDGTSVFPSAGVINFLNGAGMDITGSGNNITFNSMGGGLTWVSVAGTSQTLAAGKAYVPTNGAQTVFSLPATAAFGDFYIISGMGAGGWTIQQGAGQSVIAGLATSTIGGTGSVTSTNQYDTVEIVCVVANTTFKLTEWAGNLTVV